MNEISDEIVGKIIGRIYRDTVVSQKNGDNYIQHNYKLSDFGGIVKDEVLHHILGFLPNVNYRGAPFVMSVIFDKKTKEYEIIVKNNNY